MIPYKGITLSVATGFREADMYVLAAIIGGLFCGAAFAFMVGVASYVPYLGWLDQLVIPAFYVVGIPSGVFIGLKAEGREG